MDWSTLLPGYPEPPDMFSGTGAFQCVVPLAAIERFLDVDRSF